MLRVALVALALLPPALAGCVDTVEGPVVDSMQSPADVLQFSPPTIIDGTRSGGEPVITITPTGTILVAAHPGATHTEIPPSGGLVSATAAQSYIWRSVDGGATWSRVGLVNGDGPQGPWAGVSDPDFAVDAEGRVYFTDLGPLTHAAIMRSDDDGATWTLGNPVGSTYGPLDRQWLATLGHDVYFTANYFVEQRVLKSSDQGVTWSQVGTATCGEDFIGHEGVLYLGCSGPALDVSEDGGVTWNVRSVPGGVPSGGRAMAEPAPDAAGNVWITWLGEDGVIWVAGTPDRGVTWTVPVDVSSGAVPDGTNQWPWIVAGDEGRVSVVWYGAAETGGVNPGEVDDGAEWFVYQATLTDAHTGAPKLAATKATASPVHVGKVCQNGTVCQAKETPMGGDRRLGDFFEAAVDAEGYVHIAYADTTSGDSISHAGYVKQVAGPRLLTS